MTMADKSFTTEWTGGPVNYYIVEVKHPNQLGEPYQAECSDIIEALGMDFNEGEAFKALGMDFNEGEAFKALWRTAAARTLGKAKRGHEALYNYEKVAHYGKRKVILEKARLESQSLPQALRDLNLPSSKGIVA
jgi:hypothetical protein